MATESDTARITVFGGTGFLGRRVVPTLAQHGFRVRVAVRRPRPELFARLGDAVDQVKADVRDTGSVVAAVEGAAGVVNVVGLYTERGAETFEAVHVEGAGRVAEHAHQAGARLVHLSGIGADPDSSAAYIRARGQGEARVRAAAPDATILRPSVLFGHGDPFLGSLSEMMRVLPVIPLFGSGESKLQPVHVDDVAEAIARLLASSDVPAPVYELGGPRAYRYRELLELIAERLGRKRAFLPVPLLAWTGLARLMSVLPNPPLSRDQVELMRRDNVVAPDLDGFAALDIHPRAVEDELPA